MIKKLFLAISSFFLLISCERDTLEVDISRIETETHFMRFDSAFFNTDTAHFSDELSSLEQDFPLFFQSGGTQEFWLYQRTDKQQAELYREVKEVFGDLQQQNRELNRAMKHFYYYFGDHPKIDFYTYISNLDFNYPVLYNEENKVCFVAADMYLGAEKKYYQHLPAYLAYNHQPKFMVRDAIAALGGAKATQPSPSGITLLDMMIFHGKILYFTQAMMPDEKRNVIIKYKKEHLDFCKVNERSIWAYFVENNLLYSTKTEVQKRFIDPTPFSKFGMKFDSQTPGRVGQWVGWQIVHSYMENNSGASLPELLRENDSRKILKLSEYKP